MNRTALLLRTHFADDGVKALIETLRGDPGLDFYVLADERRGPLDVGDTPKISLGPGLAAELGIYGDAPNLLWRCGDYGLYAARRALPAYDAFWMIEPDVRIRAAPSSRLLARFPPPDEVDFLAAHLRPAEPDWDWGRTMDPKDGAVWRCLFAMIRVSARAVDAMLQARRKASVAFARGGGDPLLWPNDEAFTASTLVRRGLTCRDLNDFGDVYDPATFSFWIPVSERWLAAEGREGRIYHPVLSGQAYFMKLFRLAQAQGTLATLDGVIDDLIGLEWSAEDAAAHHRAIASVSVARPA